MEMQINDIVQEHRVLSDILEKLEGKIKKLEDYIGIVVEP